MLAARQQDRGRAPVAPVQDGARVKEWGRMELGARVTLNYCWQEDRALLVYIRAERAGNGPLGFTLRRVRLGNRPLLAGWCRVLLMHLLLLPEADGAGS